VKFPFDDRTKEFHFTNVMTMNKRKLIMESNKHMLNYIEVVPGENLHFLIRFTEGGGVISYPSSCFVGQLVFVTFKRDLKPISNKHRTYIRVDNFLHYEGKVDYVGCFDCRLNTTCIVKFK
jgi:hypothetical protein